MPDDAVTTEDGRRARRDRNRAAVVDALLALIQEGATPWSTEQLAERAGVSVSSVFRYFDGLDDLQEQTIERYFSRFADLFTLTDLGVGSRGERIDRLVDARIRLYAQIAPIARFARSRALDQAPIARSLAATRLSLLDQVRAHFSPELVDLTQVGSDERSVLVDSMTSFESWDLAIATHGLSVSQLRNAWIDGIDLVLGPS